MLATLIHSAIRQVVSDLRLISVITLTVSLQFAFEQYLFHSIILNKDVEPGAKHVLTPYWNTMIKAGLTYVIASLLGTMASTVAILASTSIQVLHRNDPH